MVAKVISGKNIRGVLNYNENKVHEGVARCIAAHRFGCEPAHLTFSDKLNRVTKLTALNPKVRTNAIHISLNFDPSEKLEDENLGSIATTYMGKIGFGSQPYLVYRHEDAAHPHVHIVTTNIKSDGKRIDIHNIGRNQSEKARQEIEAAFGLVRAESRKKSQEVVPSINIEKAIYGKSETKRSISNIVRLVTRSYKYTSLPELNAVLRQFNVVADPGAEGSRMKEKKGLLYSLMNEKGAKVGVPIKASSIYGKPTLAFLEKQFRLNEVLCQPLKDSLRQSIDQVLKNAVTRTDLVSALSKRGVYVLFRENAEGRVYGVTFVDNRNKVVFNGSDLGKLYGAKTILERLIPDRPIRREVSFKPEADKSANLDLGMKVILSDLVTAEGSDFISQEAAMKKRRKKRKRKGRSI